MNFSLSSKASVSLILLGALLLFLGCSSTVSQLPPEEVLKLYFSHLSAGDIASASELRYNPFREWGYMKEALSMAVVLALMSVVIRFTGMNPFSTMFNCWLIENFVSPENRKYVLLAVGAVFLLTLWSIYHFFTSYLQRIVVTADRTAFENSQIEVVGTEIKGDRAYVEYVLILPDGREFEKRAELRFQDGMWRVRKL